ncbi:MAG: ABC transporter permease [Acidobacteriota bacterium]
MTTEAASEQHRPERSPSADQSGLMDGLLQDVVYGLRRLIKSPVATLVAVISLALGIGLNTTVFSYVNFLLLRPLPVDQPDELMRVYTSRASGFRFGAVSYPDYEDLAERNQVFEELIAERFTPLSIVLGSGEPERLWGTLVSGNYFQALGIGAAEGRVLTPDDDKAPGAHSVAVLSYGFWTDRFDRDPAAVGQTLRINGFPFTIVGVARAGFSGTTVGTEPIAWVPMMMQEQAMPGADRLNSRSQRWLTVTGRLKSGVSPSQAGSAFGILASQLAEEYPEENEGTGSHLTRVASDNLPFRSRGDASLYLVSLLSVAGMVLMIACVNLANLLLAGASARRREVAMRLALGASRRRLIRQLLTESLIISLLAGGVGLLLARLSTRLLAALPVPVSLPIDTSVVIDGRVLGFTFAIAVIAGVFFGLAPALQASRTDLVPALKDAGQGRGGRRFPMRALLIVFQVAFSLLMLIAAGLFLRSLQSAVNVDPGFETEKMLLASVSPRGGGYEKVQGQEFYRQLAEQVEALPEVQAVSWADTVPLEVGASQQLILGIEGFENAQGRNRQVIDYNVVAPGYFRALGVPLQQGRDFEYTDGEEKLFGVINEAFANRYWPGEIAIGKTLKFGDRDIEVIGLASDMKYYFLGEPPRPYVYLSSVQHYQSSLVIHARTTGDPTAALAGLRRQLRELDATMPLYDVRTMPEHLRLSLLPLRLAATTLGAFGVLALVLIAIGLYGLMMYSVTLRTRELGIRMALGSGRGDVVWLVVRQGVGWVLAGLALGLVMAVATTRFLSNLLYGVSATDVATFLGVTLLLVFVAALAGFIPAHRASRLEPVSALRQD